MLKEEIIVVREFLIPTQLHELFCWVHQLQPLDLMGKPWDHYHLELQLLQVKKLVLSLLDILKVFFP